MQTPEFTVGGWRYQALPASLARYAVPALLAAHAEWVVSVFPPGETYRDLRVGWLAPGWVNFSSQVRRGLIGCYDSRKPPGPLGAARSSRQGVRLVAEAHQAHLAAQARGGR